MTQTVQSPRYHGSGVASPGPNDNRQRRVACTLAQRKIEKLKIALEPIQSQPVAAIIAEGLGNQAAILSGVSYDLAQWQQRAPLERLTTNRANDQNSLEDRLSFRETEENLDHLQLKNSDILQKLGGDGHEEEQRILREIAKALKVLRQAANIVSSLNEQNEKLPLETF